MSAHSVSGVRKQANGVSLLTLAVMLLMFTKTRDAKLMLKISVPFYLELFTSIYIFIFCEILSIKGLIKF